LTKAQDLKMYINARFRVVAKMMILWQRWFIYKRSIEQWTTKRLRCDGFK